MPDLQPSYFAPALRNDDKQVQKDLVKITHNPVIDSILSSVGGLLVILNDKRQIITANDTLLKTLGVQNIECILGQRFGEVLDCPHAEEMPGGCGTSKYCSSCGAVLAMMASLETQEISEQKCHIEKGDNGKKVDLSFLIRSCPIDVEGKTYLLLFLQDISAEERWQAMEKVFFHDLNNVIGSVMGSSEMLKLKNKVEDSSHEAQLFNQIIKRLIEEVSVHKILCENKGFEDLTRRDEYTINELNDSLKNLFESHPSSKGKNLEIDSVGINRTLFTNSTLLLRVLTNMLTNAFEASETGETVRLSTAIKDDGVQFSIWNSQFIPEKVALRVFQRNFSTKSDTGRGLGTFGMKLFGEKILGGKVNFTTSIKNGTTFTIYLPIEDR